ncbi:MAG TPA: 50S ribosomal protein L35 [Candidatus Angelobacter sp.]|jgi:large subunit ribosomal protein L35|nr:50S ribosomal protein L35 [Candidatus Angelobacter sp.]
MPKIKTHKGTQKRFRVTATGKVMRRHAQMSHMLEKKSEKRKRLFGMQHPVSSADTREVLRAAPYLDKQK